MITATPDGYRRRRRHGDLHLPVVEEAGGSGTSPTSPAYERRALTRSVDRRQRRQDRLICASWRCTPQRWHAATQLSSPPGVTVGNSAPVVTTSSSPPSQPDDQPDDHRHAELHRRRRRHGDLHLPVAEADRRAGIFTNLPGPTTACSISRPPATATRPTTCGSW